MKLADRINVKCVFVLNYTEHSKDRCTAFDMAFLTEDRKYVEYQAVTRGTAVTPDVQSQYLSIMSEYQLTARTRVFFCGVGDGEPIRLIFKAFAQPLGIKIRNVTAEDVVKRICHSHPSILNKCDGAGRYRADRRPKKYYLQRVWRSLIRKGVCPWITDAYDQHLRRRGYREYRYRKQLLRLGAYYMLGVCRKRDYDVAARARAKARNATVFGEARPAAARPVPEPGFRTGVFS